MSTPSPIEPAKTERKKIIWNGPTTFLSYLKTLWPDDPTHPAQVALRTYSLSLFLSLGPTLLPVVVNLIMRSSSLKSRSRQFGRVLRRELSFTGFPFAITVAVGGGVAFKRFWEAMDVHLADKQDDPEVVQWQSVITPAFRRRAVLSLAARVYSLMSNATHSQKAFLSNVLSSTIALFLLQRIRPSKASHRPSATFDLTLLFIFRATDVIVQHFLYVEAGRKAHLLNFEHQPRLKRSEPSGVLLSADPDHKAQDWYQSTAALLDAVMFWACSARIMWCFFYQPHRLPPSYVKWISSLADLDNRLLDVLRVMRSKEWTYGHSSAYSHLLTSYAKDRGYPSSWGNPHVLPAFGGVDADVVWKTLGVPGRNGVGGLPCELVHSGIAARWGLDNSCLTNVGIRFSFAFIQAIALYVPVHFLPLLLTRPRSILKQHRTISALQSAIRSATFLSTFISSYFFAVCLTRTLVLAKLFPWIRHDVWDGPHGCVLVGSLTCGWSILIENAQRRGEMALYVLPKAFRASLPAKWIASDHAGARLAERIVFVLSLASLLTFAVHEPDSLRGLSRWTLTFIMKGPIAGLRKNHKREIGSCPPTPISPSITQNITRL